ncbi:MAG: hypothetical protein ACYTDT_13575 [Planctomycetota bacterium]|jgi:hypothetical protein
MKAMLLIFAVAFMPILAAQETSIEVSADEIIENALSFDDATTDSAVDQIALMSPATARRIGDLLLIMEVRGAQQLLNLMRGSENENVLICAAIALGSPKKDIRYAGIGLLTSATAAQVRGTSRKYLTKKRLVMLRSMLTTPDLLLPLCQDFVSGQENSPYYAMALVMLTDHFFGASGFHDMCHALSVLMEGEPLNEKPKEGEPTKDSVTGGEILDKRTASTALLTAIWLAPPAQEFGYDVTADYAKRHKAMDKFRARLTALSVQTYDFGEDCKVVGTRYGDYLLKELPTDFKKQGYIRLMYMAGGRAGLTAEDGLSESQLEILNSDVVPLTGKEFKEFYEAYSGTRVRLRRRINKKFAKWWQDYRIATDNP